MRNTNTVLQSHTDLRSRWQLPHLTGDFYWDHQTTTVLQQRWHTTSLMRQKYVEKSCCPGIPFTQILSAKLKKWMTKSVSEISQKGSCLPNLCTFWQRNMIYETHTVQLFNPSKAACSTEDCHQGQIERPRMSLFFFILSGSVVFFRFFVCFCFLPLSSGNLCILGFRFAEFFP